MIKKDILNVMRKRYPEEQESTLLFACYLQCNKDLALKYKEILEVCCDYKDIAQKVARPLYVNEEIDEITAKNRAFDQAMLSMTSFREEGKASSLRYHIVQMLRDKEVIMERNMHIKARLDHLQEDHKKKSAIVDLGLPSSSSDEIVIVVPKEKRNVVEHILQGMHTAGLIKFKRTMPCNKKQMNTGSATKYTITGRSTHIITALSHIEQYDMRQSLCVDVNEQRRIHPIGQHRRHKISIPNSRIRVQIPKVAVGMGTPRCLTLPQGIKVLDCHLLWENKNTSR